MEMFTIKEIGCVENKFTTSTDPHELCKFESLIHIHKDYVDGLYKLDENKYLQIIFDFNQSKKFSLQCNNYSGEFKGVFATRSPKRPSMIGVTTVVLLKIDKNTLHVMGLDALNGSPVFDIKPFVPLLDTDQIKEVEVDSLKIYPRTKILHCIKQEDIQTLLLMSGQIHGHFCMGVTIGVIASFLAMKKLNVLIDGMEDIVAIVEVNSCFVDGIQFVAGCTLGNNGLIYRDIGKTAVTFANRKTGKGIRYIVNQTYMDEKRSKNPQLKDLFNEVVNKNNRDLKLMEKFKKLSCDAAFAMLEYNFNDLFTIKDVNIDIPSHAKLFDSFICETCKESTMVTRKNIKYDKELCPSCAGRILQSDGNGIKEIQTHIVN